MRSLAWKSLGLFVVAAAAALANVQPAQATPVVMDSDSSCPNTFGVCVNFTLSYDSSSATAPWSLSTDYVSSPSGVLTSTGAYYNYGKTAPAFGISNLTLVNAPTGWQSGGCTDLSLHNGFTDLLAACESTTNGINGAISPGTTLELTFTANDAFYTAVNANQIDYRAHIQNYGPTGCSLKPDTGVEGGIGNPGSGCIPVSTVPEPSTLVLLAAGLAGLGLTMRATARRRGTR